MSFFDNDVINSVMTKSLSNSLASYSDGKFAYAILNKRNLSEVAFLTNYPPEWVSQYKENSYHKTDPIVLQASTTNSPFVWGKNVPSVNNIVINRIFSHSSEYNVNNGYTFVLHDYNNHLVMLSLICVEGDVDKFIEKIDVHKKDIQMLLISTHDEMIALYKELPSKKTREHALFTERENEVLYLASTGKTYPEIAATLNVTTSTVKFHMGKIVTKIGALNAKHAISLAIESGIIIPPLL
ncbi:helix-turn-helix transcriptional regulator [Pantoea sp. App145]|uniref:helix-turn-helix transcriptional regulator n=1 Tax=Pantoea sp. App145 TaxID=3071567 RepID=UPI003A8120F7